MTYTPREFWNRRLTEQFDLRGTGETGLSLAYNQACYRLREDVLSAALRDHGFDPAGRSVLDVGCGTGFFTSFYLQRGARVTGLDLSSASVTRLSERFPAATFLEGDVGEAAPPGRYDLVNAFDVLYHITDDAAWARAVRNLGEAVVPGGLLLVTDTFHRAAGEAEHNHMRPLPLYDEILGPLGFSHGPLRPTHVLLNRELGPFRFLNRLPAFLLAADRLLLAAGWGGDGRSNRLLVARRAP